MIEGILINKTPFKERDMIGKLLSRRGTLHTFYFYGGRGGGKSQKPSLLEVGRMFKVKPALRKVKTETEIRIADEWQVLWEGRSIREDFMAFSLTCFVMELMGKMAMPDDDESISSDFEGLFNTTSNFLYYLDDSIQKKTFNVHQHLGLFLIKLIYHLGIVPQLENCFHCEKELNSVSKFIFESHQGGFTCDHCLPSELKLSLSDWERAKKIRFSFHEVFSLNYKDYKEVSYFDRDMSRDLLNYLFYHFHFQASSFKTLNMLGIF